MEIRWSDRATAELDAIFDHIVTEGGEPAAIGQVRKILAATRQLEGFPKSGRKLRVHRMRELVVPATPYIIRYNLAPEWIELTSITHAAQRPAARR